LKQIRRKDDSVAYDEDLADRVREVLPAGEAVTERQMFGGLAFMLDGHMFCGVVRDTLMVRLGPERADRVLGRPHVRPMDFTGLRAGRASQLADAIKTGQDLIQAFPGASQRPSPLPSSA
jgi:hypothetical protein